MKIYYLNLAVASDRREWMERQSSALDLELCRIEAINSAVITENDISQMNIPDLPGAVNLHAVLALTRGHMNIWKNIVASDDPYGCILEDDVVLSTNTKRLLSDPGWIPENADIVKIETNFVPILGRRPPPVRIVRGITERNFFIRELVGRHLGTAGYIISRDACIKLLQTKGFDRNHIDLLLFCPKSRIRSDMNIYQIEPALCAQQQCIITRDEFAGWSHRLVLAKKSYIFLHRRAVVGRKHMPKTRGLKKLIREINRLPFATIRLLKKVLFMARDQNQSWTVELDIDQKKPWLILNSGE